MTEPGPSIVPYLKTARSFDAGHCTEYRLNLQASIGTILFSVLNEAGDRCLALGSVRDLARGSGGLVEQVRSFTSFLHRVMETMPWLEGPFCKKQIIWEGSASTLIPAELMIREHMWEYLAFSHKLEAGETVLSDELEHPAAFNVFSVPEKIRELLTNRFSTDRMTHFSTHFITGILNDYKRRQEHPVLYALISENHLDVALAGPEGLRIHNRFFFVTPEDVIYFLLSVLQQFSIEPQDARIALAGQVEAGSHLMELLEKYAGHTELLSAPPSVHVEKEIQDAPVRKWFCTLTSLH